MSINVAVTQPENIGLTITTGNSINIGVAQIGNVGVTTTTGNLISVGIDTGSLINVNIGSNGEHNSLIALQGGSQTERYHLTKAQYDSLGGDGSFDFVSLTGNQTISGVKTFVNRPLVNGTGILLSGEFANTGYLTGYSTINYTNQISGNLQTEINKLSVNSIAYAIALG